MKRENFPQYNSNNSQSYVKHATDDKKYKFYKRVKQTNIRSGIQ